MKQIDICRKLFTYNNQRIFQILTDIRDRILCIIILRQLLTDMSSYYNQLRTINIVMTK